MNHAHALDDGDAGTTREIGEAIYVLSRVQRRAALVDEQPVVAVRRQLGVLLRARNNLDVMIEDLGEKRLLFSKAAEVRGLPCSLDVAGAAEVAGNRFARD